VPGFAAALVVLVVGGIPAAYVVGLRGVIGWGTAPLFAAFGVAVSATISGEAGWRWGVLPYLGGLALTTALACLARLVGGGWRSPRSISPSSKRWIGGVLFGVAVLVILVELHRRMIVIGDPGNISQTFDNIFHLNSVAAILDSGNASTFRFDLWTTPDAFSFYPGLWHQVTALVAMVTGASIPVAANTVTLTIALVVWPVSMAAFARTLFGPRPLLLAASVLMPFSLVQFPLLLESFGVLYPNLYSYAMVPGMLALLVCAARYAVGRRRLAPLLAAGAGAVALAVAQPNGLIAAAVTGIPLVAWEIARRSRHAWRRRRRGTAVTMWGAAVIAGTAVYVAAGTIPMLGAFRDGSDHWGPVGTVVTAAREVIVLSAGRSPELGQFRLAAPLAIGLPQYVLAGLVVVGVVTASAVARWRWVVVSYGLVAGLFVVAQALDFAGVRGILTGYWYSDAVRLAALLPVFAIPLAALGVATLGVGTARLVRAIHERSAASLRHRGLRAFPAAVAVTVVAVLGFVVVVVLPRTATVRASHEALSVLYSFDPVASDSPELVSEEELAVFEIIAATVPPGVSVAGDPWDGSAMVRALAGRQAVFPNPRRVLGEDPTLVQNHLHDAVTDPRVCEAVHRMNLGYVTRFGRHLWGGWPGVFGGLDGLEETGTGELVAQVGEARLYRITACGPIAPGGGDRPGD